MPPLRAWLGVIRVGQVRVEVVAQAPLGRVAPLRAVRHVGAVLRRGHPVEIGAEDLLRLRGQWSVVSGQWSVGRGGSGSGVVASGEWLVVSGLGLGLGLGLEIGAEYIEVVRPLPRRSRALRVRRVLDAAPG